MKKLSFVIIAFGNKTFEFHCGHGRKVRECLTKAGATELLGMTECDSSSDDRCADKLLGGWTEEVIKMLAGKYEIKEMNAADLAGGFQI